MASKKLIYALFGILAASQIGNASADDFLFNPGTFGSLPPDGSLFSPFPPIGTLPVYPADPGALSLGPSVFTDFGSFIPTFGPSVFTDFGSFIPTFDPGSLFLNINSFFTFALDPFSSFNVAAAFSGIDGGLVPIGSVSDVALIGASTADGSGSSFSTQNTGGTIFFDPAVAVGYFYDSNVAFSGVKVPSAFTYGDGLFDLSVWNGSGALNDAASYDLLLHNWNGDLYNFASTDITKILISGIEASAALDPTSPTAFVTGFTFNAAPGVTINLTQIPITADVPETQIGLLLGLGLLGMRIMRTGSSKK